MIGHNLHTHSLFSDGKSTLEEMVKAAIDQGMHTLGISDHAEVPFENHFAIKAGETAEYLAEVKRLQQVYAQQIQLYLSLEIDFIPGLMEDFQSRNTSYGLDYTIGAVHLVGKEVPENLWFIDGPKQEIYDNGLKQFFSGDIRAAVKAFYTQTNQMLQQESFDIIGHFDKIKMHNSDRYFLESEKWYKDLVLETLQLIKEKGVIAEVNTRGIYKKRSKSLFPSNWILAEMKQLEIPVIISSDAHHTSELQLHFDTAITALKNAGYHETMQFLQGQWTAKELV
ncbi:MAG: histidinol-phosphatase [Bacteroidales bacterium]|jgi:histidinol-phosphatase (PHP family)|nr:histidinol-phosphatase [Bacteroidales bacterium]